MKVKKGYNGVMCMPLDKFIMTANFTKTTDFTHYFIV